MAKKRTWRTALGDIIQDHQIRVPLLQELNVDESTLFRWVKSDTQPRRRAQLQALPGILQALGILPEKVAELRELLREAYPDLFPPREEHKPQQEDLASIPLSYYKQILSAYSRSAPENLKWTVYQHGLQQLATQLVCVRGEIRVHIMHLTRTHRCLYEAASITYDTKKIKEERGNMLSSYTHSLLFAGTETVPGQSIILRKLVASATEVALPFKRSGLVSGCLWVEADGFGQAQIELLKQYIDLLALAFTDAEFCTPDLQQIPEKEIQRQVIEEIGAHAVTADLLSEIEEIMLGKCKEVPLFLEEKR
jgi:hypothetical protein